jgi:hypothetical protein
VFAKLGGGSDGPGPLHGILQAAGEGPVGRALEGPRTAAERREAAAAGRAP